jgi:hypothetical protein
LVGIISCHIVTAEPGNELTKNPSTKMKMAIASVIRDQNKIVFSKSDGTVVQTIPIANREVEFSKTPSGNITYTIYDDARISQDRSHVAIFTRKYKDTGDIENTLTTTFRYFDSTGKLWEKKADEFSYIDDAISSDGSRILLIGTNIGGVYNQDGKLLFPVSLHFVEIFSLMISPNGKYLFAQGVVNYKDLSDSIKVFDLENKKTFCFSYDTAQGDIEHLKITSGGRFEFECLGGKVVLP